MTRSVAVHIAGQRYVIHSDAAEDYVCRLAAMVDERFRRVQRTTRQVATHKLALLTALQLADELCEERARRAALRRSVREGARRMLAAIDRAVEASVTS